MNSEMDYYYQRKKDHSKLWDEPLWAEKETIMNMGTQTLDIYRRGWVASNIKGGVDIMFVCNLGAPKTFKLCHETN